MVCRSASVSAYGQTHETACEPASEPAVIAPASASPSVKCPMRASIQMQYSSSVMLICLKLTKSITTSSINSPIMYQKLPWHCNGCNNQCPSEPLPLIKNFLLDFICFFMKFAKSSVNINYYSTVLRQHQRPSISLTISVKPHRFAKFIGARCTIQHVHYFKGIVKGERNLSRPEEPAYLP